MNQKFIKRLSEFVNKSLKKIVLVGYSPTAFYNYALWN